MMGYKNGSVNIFTCKIGHNIIVYYFVSFIISIIVIYLFSTFFNRKIKLVEYISTGTILIIGLHIALIDGLTHNIQLSTPISIIIAIAVFAICVALIFPMMKFCPTLLGRKKQ